MIALDTNVLARLLLADDPVQHRKAVQLLDDGREYTAPATVFLELAWILRSYGVAPLEIASALRSLLGLPQLKARNAVEIATSIDLMENGLEFGDALHLALSRGDDALVTFDARFAKRADRLGARPPVVRL